jgi:succinate dehydrogenase/fumarate reductase-like Fe-S protein
VEASSSKCVSCAACFFHDDLLKWERLRFFHEGFELHAWRGVLRFRMGQSLRRHVVDEEYHFWGLVYTLCCASVVLCCVVLCGYIIYKLYALTVNHSITNHNR